MNEGRPLEELTNEITERAGNALEQALAMHDASVILLATHEFSQWVAVHQGSGRELGPTDVVTFYMSYARALIDSHATPRAAPVPPS